MLDPHQGMHLAEKSAQRWQFDFIEVPTRQVTISYLPYTGLTAPRDAGNQFEIIEVAQFTTNYYFCAGIYLAHFCAQ